MKRKTVKVILSVLLCLGIAVFPLNVLAEGTEENVQEQPDETTEAAEAAEATETAETAETAEAFTYEVVSEDNKSCKITKYTGNDEAVYIPAVIDGYSVVEIGSSAFYGCKSLSSITIPEGVTSIGDSVFCNCSSLSSITIPESVTSIGGEAFTACWRLSSITIPTGVTSIEREVFWGCSSLSSITIPEGVTSIGSCAFSNCNSLSSITIPESVTSIGGEAFLGCDSMNSISISDKVTYIGDGAFSACKLLEEITVDADNKYYTSLDGVLYNKDMTCLMAFPAGKENVSIAKSVISIGSEAFRGCNNLTSITLPEEVTSLGDWAFGECSNLSKITLPEKITDIGIFTFSGCRSLNSITIPEGVASIGDWAFNNCSSLSSITIPESMTSIEMNAFRGCCNLSSITIPEGVTSIGDWAFAGCWSLSSITIPESVTSIGDGVFSECTGLTKICNDSAMEIDLSSINPYVLWYDMETGEVIEKLGTGTGIIVNTKIANDETGIPDVNFYNAVLSIYDANNDGVLTMDEVENVTSLTLTYKKIENIQGIQYFTSLKELNLSDNQITDCSPLKGMALDSLNLSNNQIADISPIKEIEVKNLNLSYNQIEDATPLTGMALEELYVSNNRISDITPLCSLTQIKGLSITFNNISDLSPLKGSPLWKRLQEYAIATQDTFELDYYIGTVSHIRKIAISGGNPLTREQVMEALPEELIYYTAGKKHPFRDEMVATGRTWMDSEIFLDEVIKNDETGIPDPNLYQVLLEAGDANQDGVLTSEEAGHISEVNASNKGITDLTGLVYLRGIVEKLDLRENNISDLTPLAKGPYMVDYLYLDHNNISDITPLSNRAIPMWAIRLSYNNISDTTPLKDLLVEELYLDHNKISSIESMSEIVDSHYCKVLDLSDNNITDISPLAGSVGIQKLTLSNNKIQNLDVLEKLIYITTLRVDGNPITDISPIGTLNYLYLRDLRLDETQIPDLAELKNYNNLDNKCVYAERFFDENGNTQIANTIYNFRSGSSYTSKQPEIEGYEPASEEGYVTYKGTLTEDITYIDFYYNKVSEPDSETKPETEADGDYIVDITGNDTEIKKEDFEKIINENASRDVIFKSNVEITIRFAKGTMKEVDGKVSYDMGAEMTRDFDKLDGKVQKIIDKKNLVSYVSYHYSGELPSEAEIQINVGIEWTGKTLYYYYYDVKKGILELIQEAVVNPEGIMTVRQNHCSDYVILSEKTADAVSENETQQESTKEAEDEQEDEQQAIHSADSAVNTKDAAPTAWLFLLSVISGTVLIAFAAGDKKRYQ